MGKITAIAKNNLDELFSSYDVVAEGASAFVCDMKYDYSRWSKKAVEYFGLPSEYMVNAGEIWAEHIHPDDRKAFLENIDALFKGTEKSHDLQYRAKAADGSYKTCICKGTVIKSSNGNPRYFVGVIRNQTTGEAIDELTGLPNQAVFFRELGICIDNQIPVTVVMMGTSHFSRINDLYGYDFANHVLQHSSRYISLMFKDIGMVFRLDGIKLAVISRRATIDEIRKRYEELQEVVGKTFLLEGRRIDLPVNAGALYLDSFLLDTRTVFSCLTHAYEQSKYDRGGNFCVFENALAEDTRTRLALLNTIRSSVTKDCKGFENFYQPFVDAKTGKLKGAEALIRWHDEDGHVVPPNDFIPVLENDALFPLLGRWILRKGMEDTRDLLKDYPDFVLNVNLSYAQLKRSDFVDMVKEAISEMNFPAKNLCLELTERCRLIDIDQLRNVMFALRQEGVTFALDDFGTGFASVTVLKELECEVVKIDRKFVKNIVEDKKEENLVAAIAALSSVYDANTCIEGIETHEMADILRKYPVKTYQGYFYSKPVPIGEFKEKIKSF